MEGALNPTAFLHWCCKCRISQMSNKVHVWDFMKKAAEIFRLKQPCRRSCVPCACFLPSLPSLLASLLSRRSARSFPQKYLLDARSRRHLHNGHKRKQNTLWGHEVNPTRQQTFCRPSRMPPFPLDRNHLGMHSYLLLLSEMGALPV